MDRRGDQQTRPDRGQPVEVAQPAPIRTFDIGDQVIRRGRKTGIEFILSELTERDCGARAVSNS
jgi:hypothetical protein